MENTQEQIIWEYLVEASYTTDEALQLLTNVCGYSVDTLESAIYALTGYRTLDQLKEYEGGE